MLLSLTQLKEQTTLLFSGSNFDHAQIADHILEDLGLNPLHRKGSQTHTGIRIKVLHGFHQTDISLLDQI